MRFWMPFISRSLSSFHYKNSNTRVWYNENARNGGSLPNLGGIISPSTVLRIQQTPSKIKVTQCAFIWFLIVWSNNVRIIRIIENKTLENVLEPPEFMRKIQQDHFSKSVWEKKVIFHSLFLCKRLYLLC